MGDSFLIYVRTCVMHVHCTGCPTNFDTSKKNWMSLEILSLFLTFSQHNIPRYFLKQWPQNSPSPGFFKMWSAVFVLSILMEISSILLDHIRFQLYIKQTPNCQNLNENLHISSNIKSTKKKRDPILPMPRLINGYYVILTLEFYLEN